MKINFKNQVVLITGATRGIGEQLAKDFEKLGANLILTGTHRDQIDELNRNLKKQKRKNIKYYCVDFLNKNLSNFFIRKLRNHKRIDVCINNAGINRINYFHETLEKDWDEIIQINLKTPFILCREASKIMKKNRYGRIVNIASIFGVISRERRSIYTSSKSGLIGMTKSIAIDLAPYNILANCVSPGFVLTDLTKKILKESEIEDLKSLIPLGRLATTGDISRVVLFLASDLNTYITGQNIIVDGGYVNI